MQTNLLRIYFFIWFSLLVISILPKSINSAKILSVSFISSKSHKIIYEPLLHTLAKRGHEVTIISPFKSNQTVKNVTEILGIDFEKLMESENESTEIPNLFEMKDDGANMNPFMMFDIFSQLCSDTYDIPEVKEVMNQKFDLIIFPELFNDCVTGLIYKLNTSVIIITSTTAQSWVTSNLGGHLPPSFVPNMFIGYTSRMNFYQRTINLLTEVTSSLIRDYYFEPKMEAVYRKKLNDSTIPSADEILKNTSLILSNGHFTLGSPVPFLPDVIEVGGMHCRPAQPLPKDLEEFASSSKHGFILFSMGTALTGSDMPEEKRKQILEAFSKLKQNVLWKWETEIMLDLPKNVKLSKWLPQQDILGHPKLKVFVTHGGFGSTTESAYHGVPLVGIPMFSDQQKNMQNSENLGFAITLDYDQINEETLFEGINKVINNPKYKENAMALSKVFQDQPDKPLDRAVFWTEYVLRHKGAVHLRSAARDLSFIQYHSFDVIGFLLTIIVTVLYIIYTILRFIAGKICGSKFKTSSDLRKKKN